MRRARRHHPLARGAGTRAPRRDAARRRRPDDRRGARRARPSRPSRALVGRLRRRRARRRRARTGSAALKPTQLRDRAPACDAARPGPRRCGRRPRHQGRAHQPRPHRRRGARLRRRALPPGRAARRVRERRSPATYLNRSTTITSKPPASADASAPPGVAARVERHDRALARPPRALHGHRRPAGGRSATPAPGTSSTTSTDPAARRQRGGRRAAGRSCTYRRRRRGRGSIGAVRARRRRVRPRPYAFVAHGVRGRARAAHRSPRSCTWSGSGARRPRRPARSWRESAYSLAGIAARAARPRVDVAQGRRVGGAARARRRHLPVRRRRPGRRHDARPLADPDHVLPAWSRGSS